MEHFDFCDDCGSILKWDEHRPEGRVCQACLETKKREQIYDDD